MDRPRAAGPVPPPQDERTGWRRRPVSSSASGIDCWFSRNGENGNRAVWKTCVSVCRCAAASAGLSGAEANISVSAWRLSRNSATSRMKSCALRLASTKWAGESALWKCGASAARTSRYESASSCTGKTMPSAMQALSAKTSLTLGNLLAFLPTRTLTAGAFLPDSALALRRADASCSLALSVGTVSTVSMTWTTPLDAITSALVTVASPLTLMVSAVASTRTLLPTSSVGASVTLPARSLESALPLMTWYFRISASCWRFSSANRNCTVAVGSLLNAASVGAKTVNGPLVSNVCARPAAFSAVSSSVKLPALSSLTAMLTDLGAGRGFFLRPPHTEQPMPWQELQTTAVAASNSASWTGWPQIGPRDFSEPGTGLGLAFAGMSTASIRWTTPLFARRSALTTLAVVTALPVLSKTDTSTTPLNDTEMRSRPPPSVWSTVTPALMMSLANKEPTTTWLSSTSCGTGPGWPSPKALLIGANRVNLPPRFLDRLWRMASGRTLFSLLSRGSFLTRYAMERRNLGNRPSMICAPSSPIEMVLLSESVSRSGAS